MDFIAKKHTILMGEEPLDVWIKNDQVKRARFMDRKIALNFSKEVIDKIKDNPARVINGKKLEDNKEFTNTISKMMSQKLEIAIAKNDKKTLSRFARSNLVPENMKDNFLEAINRQRGIRGMLVRAINNTNQMFQNMANKIDMFFDKLNDRIANQKLDKYLSEYQSRELNRIDDNLHKPKAGVKINSNLLASAELFVKEKKEEWREKEKENPLDQTYYKDDLQKFLKQSVSKGFTVNEASLAFAKAHSDIHMSDKMFDLATDGVLKKSELTEQIHKLKDELLVYQKKEASQNETIEDFKTLAKGMSATAAIDLLVENKEYLKMDSKQQKEIEDKTIFKQEPIQERAEEIKAISKEMQKEITTISKDELKERVEDISSEKSFKNLTNAKGELDADKLMDYSKKLESFALAIKEKANSVTVTKEDLALANKGVQQQHQKAVGAENVR